MKIIRWIGAVVGIAYLVFFISGFFNDGYYIALQNPHSWQRLVYDLWLPYFLPYLFMLIAIIFLMIRDNKINIIVKRVIGSIGILYFLFIVFVQLYHTNIVGRYFDSFWVFKFIYKATHSFPVRIDLTTVDLIILFVFVYIIIAIVYLLFWDWFKRSKEG